MTCGYFNPCTINELFCLIPTCPRKLGIFDTSAHLAESPAFPSFQPGTNAIHAAFPKVCSLKLMTVSRTPKNPSNCALVGPTMSDVRYTPNSLYMRTRTTKDTTYIRFHRAMHKHRDSNLLCSRPPRTYQTIVRCLTKQTVSVRGCVPPSILPLSSVLG